MLLLSLAALTSTHSALAQIPGFNSSRSKSPPFRSGAYWQQDVDYEIDVTLADDGRTITGSQIIIYTNNSPDTLHKLYLKAFPNSARKGSLMDKRNREFEDYSLAYSDSSQWGYLRISDVTGRGGKRLTTTLDDTIYEIILNAPIVPGATARINLNFETRLPIGVGNRHELIAGQSKAAYWYPQVCVYDRKMGWVNSQYLGRGECYGDFGNFTVSITAPEDRIVTATGMLANRAEVLPDSLRAEFDITRFIGEPDSWPAFDFDKTKYKTWKFYARKVNDFAWVASADFCIDEQMYNGVHIEVFPRRVNARNWIKVKEYSARALETFSELYGDYGWPEIKVTDSYDGMEYPMITFCRGGDPSPTFPLLVYHEIGHFWFMGLVGSNQVDRPFLDEGFTTMAEIVAMEKYHGRKGNNISHTGNWYQERFYPLDEDRDARGYRIYLDWARSGYDLPMIISADNTSEYWAYRNSSYYKPVVMHFSLRAIYGDQLYFNALRSYARKWFFKHPYEEDFVREFSGVVGERLDEYFAQWLSSRKQIDYKYESHKRLTDDTYNTKLSKPGDFVTPIDIAFINKAGDTTFYTVNPEGHNYIKPTHKDGGTWRQYRQPSNEYQFEATVPGGISKAVVDPYNLLPDVNRLNNESGFLPPIETRVDAMFFDVPSMHKYSLRLRPDFWYDQPNGLIVGGHAQGSYIKTDYKFSLDAGVGLKSGRPQVDLKVSHPFRPLGKLASVNSRILRVDLRTFAQFGIAKEYRPKWTGSSFWKASVSVNYSNIDGEEWTRDDGTRKYRLRTASPTASQFIAQPHFRPSVWNALKTMWIESKVSYALKRRTISLSGSATGRFFTGIWDKSPSPEYLQLRVNQTISLNLHKLPKILFSISRFRSGRSGGLRGSTGEFAFHLTRAQPFDEFADSRIFRSPGTFPNAWRNSVYLDASGVRGYENRTLYGNEGTIMSLIVGPIDILNQTPLKGIPILNALAKYRTEFFLQSGWIQNGGDFLTPWRLGIDVESAYVGSPLKYYSSAGISFASPSVWNGQKLRFDIPLYLSRPLPGEDKWDFRFSAALVLPLNTEKWP
jgi:Peptidase family M1 domain